MDLLDKSGKFKSWHAFKTEYNGIATNRCYTKSMENYRQNTL